MPNCAACGRSFSSFSFGKNPTSECPDCRKARAQAGPVATASTTLPSQVGVARTLALPPPVVTLTIMGLNALVYVAMGLSGVSWTEPSTVQAIRWGADFGPLTLSSEPWRLLTSTFVHFGIVHIGLNMWCLFNLGQLLEPLMGSKRFGVMYVSSGLAASIVSVAWNPWRVSTGASGAIFGVAGALVTYLALKKTSLEKELVRKNLRSLAFFIGYNLLYGLSGAVDNSAHLGGLISGLILGAIIPAQSRSPFSPADSANASSLPATSAPPFDAGSVQGYSADPAAWNIAVGSAVLLILAFLGVRTANMPAVYYGKAVQLTRAGHVDQGADELQQAVTLNPKLLLGQAMLGEWRLEENNPSAAILPLEEAKALAPAAYDVRNNLGLAYLGSGRLRDAQAEIFAALPSEKEDAWRGHFILAEAEDFDGYYSAASQNLQEAIKLKPDFHEAQDALASLPPADKWQQPPSLSTPIALPYSTLMIKSEAWPYYP